MSDTDKILDDLCQESGIGMAVGSAFLIRTLTFSWVGRLVGFTGKCLILENASWVADAGRYHASLANGLESQESSEIEPAPGRVYVAWTNLVDAAEYNHPLPTKVK